MCPPLHEPSASGATLDLPRASLCPPKNPEEHPKIHRLRYRGCDRILPVPPVFSPPPKNGCNRRIPSSQTPKLFGSRSSAHPGWLGGDKGPIHPVLKHHWYLEKPEWILRSQSPTAYPQGRSLATWGGKPPPGEAPKQGTALFARDVAAGELAGAEGLGPRSNGREQTPHPKAGTCGDV